MTTTALSGHAVAQVRRALGLTQQQLAVALGVERETVTRWERGTQGVSRGCQRSLQKLLTDPRVQAVLARKLHDEATDAPRLAA